MKAKSIVSWSLCTLMVFQGLVSCMHRPSPGTEIPSPITSLDRIGVTELDDRVRIEVEGGRPMTYSLSTNASPASVTVELPGFSRGSHAERLAINKGPVLELAAQDVSAPQAGMQLTVALAAATEPDVHIEGTRLIIDFPKPHVSEERVRQDDPVSTATSDEQSHGLPAKTLTRIDIQKNEAAATIILVADGEFSYEAKRSSGNRLVLDVANVTSSLRSRVLAINHPSVRQVRIGQHAKKVRLVFDLASQAIYSIRPDGNQLAIELALHVESDKSVPDAVDQHLERLAVLDRAETFVVCAAANEIA